MAKGKKSFILYSEWEQLFETLNNKQAAELIRHIFRFVNDRKPTLKEATLKPVWAIIEPTLIRDLKKWEDQLKQRSESGRLGGLKSGEIRRSKSKQKEAKGSTASKIEANEAVNVNVNVNASTKEQFMLFKHQISEKDYESWRENLYLKYKLKPKTLELILDKFIIHLLSIEKEHKSIQEFKSHFLHWCNRIEPEGKLDQYKKQHEVIDTTQRL